jgi:predicted protein tyrosine phosphatase
VFIDDAYKKQTMMQILIRSRQTVLKDYPLDGPWVLISIHEASFPPVDPPSDGLQDLLVLKFSDLDTEPDTVTEALNTTPMDAKQAESILRFFYKWKDRVDYLVCQCDAGISRSSAVAAALSVVNKGPRQDQWVFSNPMYKPNMHVYRLLLELASEMGILI